MDAHNTLTLFNEVIPQLKAALLAEVQFFYSTSEDGQWIYLLAKRPNIHDSITLVVKVMESDYFSDNQPQFIEKKIANTAKKLMSEAYLKTLREQLFEFEVEYERSKSKGNTPELQKLLDNITTKK